MEIYNELKETKDGFKYWEYNIPIEIVRYDGHNIKAVVTEDKVIEYEVSGCEVWFYSLGTPVLHIYDRTIAIEKFKYFTEITLPEEIEFLEREKFINKIKRVIKYIEKAERYYTDPSIKYKFNIDVKAKMIDDLQSIINEIKKGDKYRWILE